MSKINSALIASLIRQIYIVDKHQDLAADNKPNQLESMLESLNLFIEAIGNANCVEIASIDEDSINVLIERTRLQSNESSFDENLDCFTE